MSAFRSRLNRSMRHRRLIPLLGAESLGLSGPFIELARQWGFGVSFGLVIFRLWAFCNIR